MAFPSNPQLGDTYGNYVWSGESWRVSNLGKSLIKSQIFTSDPSLRNTGTDVTQEFDFVSFTYSPASINSKIYLEARVAVGTQLRPGISYIELMSYLKKDSSKVELINHSLNSYGVSWWVRDDDTGIVEPTNTMVGYYEMDTTSLNDIVFTISGEALVVHGDATWYFGSTGWEANPTILKIHEYI